MNKTEAAVTNAFCALLWKPVDVNDAVHVLFELRKNFYELILSEEGSILYLKKNNNLIVTIGISITDTETYAGTIELLAKQIRWFERKH